MNEILREIGKLYRCLDSISNIEFKQFQLAKGQYAYLVRVCENPGIIQERISEMLKIDRATASRAIQKLEQAALVEKREDTQNRRVHRLFPTERGMQVFEVLKAEEDHSGETTLRGISEADRAVLLQLLSRMQNNLDPEWTFVKKGGQRSYLKQFVD